MDPVKRAAAQRIAQQARITAPDNSSLQCLSADTRNDQEVPVVANESEAALEDLDTAPPLRSQPTLVGAAIVCSLPIIFVLFFYPC